MGRSAWMGALLSLGVAACGTDEVSPPGSDAGVDVIVNPDGSVPTDGGVDVAIDAAPSVDPGALWAKRYGESGNVTPLAVATDGTGNSLYAGQFTGTINLAGTGPSGTEAITTAVDTGYVAKLDPNGTHLWSKKWTSTVKGVFPVAIATDKSGAAFFAGQLYGTANLGGSPLVSGGTFSAFVAKLDGAGNHVWSKSFDGGNGTSAYALSVATDSAGDVLIAGQFTFSVGFGGNLLTSAGSRDYFLVKLGGNDGHHIWSYRYGDVADQSGIAITVDANDSITAVGRFAGAVDFGGGALTGNGASGFVAHFDKNAAHQWSKLLATAQPTSVAADVTGNVYYTGGFTGTVDFAGTGNAGAEVLTATGSAANLFLTKLASTGAHQFSRRFAGTGFQASAGVAVSPSGNVAITGSYQQGTPDFSAGGVAAPPMNCNAKISFYAASFSAAGAHRWSLCVGAPSSHQDGAAVAVASTGHVFVHGEFYDPATVSMVFPKAGGGSITLTRAATTDAFMAKLAP